ncbi:MAG: hypothetical protein ACJ8EL_10235 [Rhizomicrobium sp.]
MRQPIFQMIVAHGDPVGESVAGIETGALKPRHLPRHPGHVVVRHRSIEPIQRARDAPRLADRRDR